MQLIWSISCSASKVFQSLNNWKMKAKLGMRTQFAVIGIMIKQGICQKMEKPITVYIYCWAMSPCVRFKLKYHTITFSSLVFSNAEVTWQTSGDQSEITNWIISIWMLLSGSTYPCSWSISFQQLYAVLWATLEKCHKFMKNFEGALR